LYRQRFLTFLLIALIVYVPYALFVAVVQPSWIAEGPPVAAPEPSPMSGRVTVRAQPVSPFEYVDVTGFAVWMAGIFLFGFVLLPLCGAAMVQNISASYLGEELSAGGSYSRAAPRFLPLLGTNILYGLVVLLGYIMCIVPGIIFILWFLLVVPVVMLEGLAGTAALRRSRELMRGNTGKGLSLMLVVGILGFVLSWAIGMVSAFIPWPHPSLAVFVQTVLAALWLPIQTAPVILLYYDLRIRKEAFDLQRLAESLGQSAAPPGRPAVS
jgi:hypothetical protein